MICGSKSQYVLFSALIVLACCEIGGAWANCVNLPSFSDTVDINLLVRRAGGRRKVRQDGSTPVVKLKDAGNLNYNRYKYTMRRWSLNGDIYVSLLGKASIGGDRHYLRHTSSNSVDFVGSSNNPTNTCDDTLWKCEGQCANCGDCSFITSTNIVPIRLENPQATSYRMAQNGNSMVLFMSNTYSNPIYTFFDAIGV